MSTKVHVVLDRSGSMSQIAAEAISSYNEYVKTLAETDGDTTVSLTIFDNQSIDTLYQNIKASDVKPLTSETYRPRGMTPLYDAIGTVISNFDPVVAEKKALVILTDGHENCSREHNKDSIKKLIDTRQKEGWLVLYLGANQDAMAEGAKFGTVYDNSMTFDVSNVGATLRAASRATNLYASGAPAEAYAFTEAERSASIAK